MRKMMIGALLAMTLGMSAAAARADSGLLFVPYGAFFSDQAHVVPAVDPEVFVRDPDAPEETGLLGIHHVAGFRPASLPSDERTQQLYNAEGKPLGFTLGKWLNASGRVARSSDRTIQSVRMSFTGLIPSAGYTVSMRQAHATDAFTASSQGTASLDFTLPSEPADDDAIVVAYHNDGASSGLPGVSVHEQLVVRLRAPSETATSADAAGGSLP
jgi:hypothetical protein